MTRLSIGLVITCVALSACADRDGGGDRERELSDLRAEVADVRAEQRALREELRSLRGASTDGDAETPAGRDAGVAPDAAPAAKTAAKRPQPLPPQASGGKPLEQATVNIEIDSNPAGATVFLGDKRMGVTPIIVKAPAGNEEIHVRLEKSGFRPRLMNLRPDEDTKLHLQLSKK